MSYTLLVWETIPEDTDFYLIPNEEVEEDGRLELMRQAHNNFINNSDYTEGLAFLNAALTPEEHINDEEYFDDGTTNTNVNGEWVKVKMREASPKEWRCIFAKYKQDTNKVVEANITRVILSGFLL